jgi:hypothetical protein
LLYRELARPCALQYLRDVPRMSALYHAGVLAVKEQAASLKRGCPTPATVGPSWTPASALDDVRALWERIFADQLGGRPITRAVLTHFHLSGCGSALLINRSGLVPTPGRLTGATWRAAAPTFPLASSEAGLLIQKSQGSSDDFRRDGDHNRAYRPCLEPATRDRNGPGNAGHHHGDFSKPLLPATGCKLRRPARKSSDRRNSSTFRPDAG